MPQGEVPQNLFEHLPGNDKVFIVAPKIMIFIDKLCFRLILERVRYQRRYSPLFAFVGRQAESALRVISRGNIGWRFAADLKYGPQLNIWGRFSQQERFYKICLSTFLVYTRFHGGAQNRDFHRKA